MQNAKFVSFDSKNDTFHRNICSSTKGRIRRAVVERDLMEIPDIALNKKLSILDMGCGDGCMSDFLLSLNPDHEVVLCDVSSDAVNLARERLGGRNCSFYVADVFNLPSEISSRRFDLVLCHAMVEWIREQRECLEVLSELLVPGGLLSLLYYNRDGLLYQSLVVGNFPYVYSGLKSRHRQKMTPPYPVDPHDMLRMCSELGYEITGETGVRVFHDYMRHKDQYEDKFADILHFELEYSRDDRFRRLGRYIHLMLRKPGQ